MIGSERLESIDLLGGILDHGPRLVSFDVFDTLLWRPCRRPVELFHRLGEELQRQGHLRDLGPVDFALRRIEAERAARFAGAGIEARSDS